MGSKILTPACTALNLFYKVLTVEHTSPDHSTQVSLHNTSQWNTSNQTRVDLNSSMTITCMLSKRCFKNHQPARGYTGNHCTISKLRTWETIKIFKNETQKIYSGGFLCEGFLSWGFLSGGLCPAGFCPGGFVLEPSQPTLRKSMFCTIEAYSQTEYIRACAAQLMHIISKIKGIQYNWGTSSVQLNRCSTIEAQYQYNRGCAVK